jgi:L-lactate dehydrogenase complex protein LldF
VKIDIPSILVELRAQHVEARADTHVLPSLEALAMKAAAAAMGDPQKWSIAQRTSRAGRLLGRRRDGADRRITALPPPMSAWTSSRDLPLPPEETFRQWWARERS